MGSVTRESFIKIDILSCCCINEKKKKKKKKDKQVKKDRAASGINSQTFSEYFNVHTCIMEIRNEQSTLLVCVVSYEELMSTSNFEYE